MTAFSWTPKPRPGGMTFDIFGVRCRCGRKLYSSLRDLGDALVDGKAMGVSELEFCRGCDKRAPECWCPEVPA